ncbi:MAG: DUF1559 domain-containing protein [Pirellulaceae bacterium]|jgi:hypothetical protein|nr:DUF1559 domain-containing protein [Pirellulaceae bacterium]
MSANGTVGVLFLAGSFWLTGMQGAWSQAPAVPAGEQVPPAGERQAWLLEDALTQLRLYPRDPYLQYVALQLARRENRAQAVAGEIQQLTGRSPQWQERTGQVNLFSIFTGALAVQESLQLDTMVEPAVPREEMRPQAPADAGDRQGPAKVAVDGRGAAGPEDQAIVRIADLAGPSVQSHPWTQMLAGREAAMSPLARCVPPDYYYIRFGSVNKLLTLLDQGDIWGTHLFSQAAQKAYRHEVRERMMRQLALEINPLLQPFYDLAVQELAVVGSDLFAVEGSDVTLLFRVTQPQVFTAQMDGFLTRAAEATPDVERSEDSYRGVSLVHLTSPDRRVHVYSAYPAADLHVRSNSRVALERVLDVITRRPDEQIVSLGDTDEFKYIRTLMPYGADEEDGLIYLSDPFIRRMVGAELKLTQARRRVCLNHLRMIGHAAALYQAEQGRVPASLEELAAAQCTPGTFGQGRLACPCGGEYALSADGCTATCSHHGPVDLLLPCSENPLREVSSREAQAYEQFVQQYSEYWRTFFDPIAVRVQVTPERYRLETIVLPLIDNSIYTSLAMALGGEPQPLDAPPIPRRTIFSGYVKLDKPRLLDQAGITPPPDEQAGPAAPRVDMLRTINQLKQIGLAMHNYHDTYRRFPAAGSVDRQQRPLLSWRVHLLPFMEQLELYQKFHLDEPWDSPHNRELIPQMPAVYRSVINQPLQDGVTRFVLPVGAGAIFPSVAAAPRFPDIRDGTSNTIMALHATEKHAVVWTKPEDVSSETAILRQALFADDKTPGLVCFADGSVLALRNTLSDQDLRALVTRSGGETTPDLDRMQADMPRPVRLFWIPGVSGLGITQKDAYEFMVQGVGDQVGLHTYDADQFFDFQLMGFLGQMAGNFAGRRGGGMNGEFLPFVFLGASLNSPVYISIELEDTDVVDRFLDKLDAALAPAVRQKERGGFFDIDMDFYRLPLAGDVDARSFGFQFGPVKWRFFWARLDKTLYITSKSYILEDLAAQLAGSRTAPANPDAVSPSAGHAMIRIRPQHWNQVLPGFRLGWAERHRLACLDNVGRLSSVARLLPAVTPDASAASPEDPAGLHARAEQVYGVRCFCPEGGRYVLEGNGVVCTLHGSAAQPRQLAVPADNGAIDTLLRGFSDLTVTLTFLEDGLHAVLLIDRQP